MTLTVRRALLASALLSLALGALAGLARLGFGNPAAPLAPWHGALMSAGFLGLLISLERAVALDQAWGYGAPILAALGTVGVVLGWEAGAWVWVLAGGWALALQVTLGFRRPGAAGWVMALGSLAWALGLAVWAAQGSLVSAALFWAAFPVLTIAGERLELAFQVIPRGPAWWAFMLGAGLCLAGPALGLAREAQGARLAALGWLGLSLWMLRYDLLKRGWAQGGLARFMSAALTMGYAWLALASLLLWAWTGGQSQLWDGALHAVFLGFMFAMVFAHAPVIFPAVAGVQLQWHQGHYLHLAAMSAALAGRVLGGALGWLELKRYAALAQALVLVVFVANQAFSAFLARRSASQRM